MEMVIVTGLSGAGKTRTINSLEDIGFYCVDNMPPKLISKFAEICIQTNGTISKIAIVSDTRGGIFFKTLMSELEIIDKEEKFKYKLLFMDSSEEELIRRYRETRRKHPLIDECGGSIEAAVSTEREIMKPLLEKAHFIVDTTFLSVAQLKERLSTLFLDNSITGMLISCLSFGFKYGHPGDADLVFDVRCLPNPFYIPGLKTKTGLDKDVKDFVMNSVASRELFKKITELIDFLIPLYMEEGKSHLGIAFGCTGGKHRSVTFAELLHTHLIENYRVIINHRDISKM